MWVLAATLICGLPTLTSCSEDNEVIPEGKGEGTTGDYRERSVAVSREGKSVAPVTLRFYNDMPNVPYISVSSFYDMLMGKNLTVTKTGEADYVLTTTSGEKATFNTTSETMAFDNYVVFISQFAGPAGDEDDVAYAKLNSMDYQPAAGAVTFDMKKYGIDLKGDNEQVYVPLSTLTDLFSDCDYKHVLYNGERVFITDFEKKIGEVDRAFAKKPYEAKERAADLAAYSYGELCFVIDHYYGMPGRSSMEKDIQTKGFDASIPDKLRELLKSTDMSKYVLGLEYVSTLLDDGGHTSISPIASADNGNILTDVEILAFMNKCVKEHLSDYTQFATTVGASFVKAGNLAVAVNAATDKRNQIFGVTEKSGPKAYGKVGNTVYCLFDAFGPVDGKSWEAFYKNEGPLPTFNKAFAGDITTVTAALDYAISDPEVENFVVDLSLNPGGNADVLVAITSLVNGQSFIPGENTLTKQKVKLNFLVDSNFDRVFDEKDLKPRYSKLNFAFLTSRYSFSCGNLLPSLMKDAGYLVIGEKSGGGACLVQNFSTPEGFCYSMSSYLTRLTDKNGKNIDGGIEPHIALAVGTGVAPNQEGESVDYPDFSAFYNKEVGTKISDWYKKSK